MTVFNGKSIYGAIVSGNVCILKKPSLCCSRIHVEDTQGEINRFHEAKFIADNQLQEIYDRTLEKIGELNAQIFGIHMMMLQDEDYCGSIERIITEEGVNAEYAVARTSDRFATMLEQMDNEYMQARSADVRDVSNRLISILTDTPFELGEIPENSVVCADDITPSEAAALDKSKTAAFVTAHGSPISHTAILAHSMNIPAVIGTGKDFLSIIQEGQEIIVDAFAGQVILNPDRAARNKLNSKLRTKYSAKGDETRTLDGKRVTLLALGNEPLPMYADGFAVLEPKFFEDEQRQFEYYKEIAEVANQSRAILRMPPISRFTPDSTGKVRRQLRAVLRAGVYGSPGILFPTVSSVQEARRILGFCDEIKNELRESGVKRFEGSKLGFMIETPATAIISDLLAPISDFFIINSDSLARYTLAESGEIFWEDFADAQKAVVMRLIAYAARNAVKIGCPVGICGSFAEDKSLIPDLLKHGITKLIVSPDKVEDIRRFVMSVDLRI